MLQEFAVQVSFLHNMKAKYFSFDFSEDNNEFDGIDLVGGVKREGKEKREGDILLNQRPIWYKPYFISTVVDFC